MDVSPSEAAGSFPFWGRKYLFCTRKCLETFQADPERFVNQGKR
jgi:YHS domain-containing protein